MTACITGWSHSKFGVNVEQTSENMIADVVEKASVRSWIWFEMEAHGARRRGAVPSIGARRA